MHSSPLLTTLKILVKSTMTMCSGRYCSQRFCCIWSSEKIMSAGATST